MNSPMDRLEFIRDNTLNSRMRLDKKERERERKAQGGGGTGPRKRKRRTTKESADDSYPVDYKYVDE